MEHKHKGHSMNAGNNVGHSGSPGMSHGSALGFLRRFWIVTFLLIPLVLTNDFFVGLLGLPVLMIGKWIQFFIATVIFGFSLVFFQHAWHEIKMRAYGMMTLVSVAVGAGYLFSAASTFIPALEVEFYLEISTLIWVLLFGHYLEARSSASAGNALQEVAKLLPKKAHKLVDGKEVEIDISDLSEGDKVLVKPGEKIPADGRIISGEANIDESLISGESKPVKKGNGDEVVAGSICIDGSLTVVLSRVGEHSTIGQIQKLISEAQQTKPRSQRIADRASAVLTGVAGVTALLTILVWSLLLGESFVFAITLGITVLVIACPHALGLAIPTVTTITTSLAVKNGVFIKDLSKIEVIKKADYIVFDKTGTLTRGEFGVVDIFPSKGYDKDAILRVAASIEQHSSHVIGTSIVQYAKEKNIKLSDISEFKNIAGKGIQASIGDKVYTVGNKAMVEGFEVNVGSRGEAVGGFSNAGRSIVYVAEQGKVIGAITLADEIRQESMEAVGMLHKLGVKVAMLTGDNESVARSVADDLSIDTYFAEVLPEDKYKHIKELQGKGNVVLMVGDGVNDAPALTQADSGVAIGAGTDVAVEAGDVVLTRSNPNDVVRLIILSRKVYGKMIQNLVWAFGYNVVAIPAAAGIFAAWGFFLRPEVGALVMSLSTVIVVLNALTLKKADLSTL